MTTSAQIIGLRLYALACVVLGFLSGTGARQDPRQGLSIHDFDVSTMSGSSFASKSARGKVLIVIYVSAEQTASERVIRKAQQLLETADAADLRLVFLTADFVYQSYFQKLWKDLRIQAPLGFDSGREFYEQSGLMALPTTLVIDNEGKLIESVVVGDHRYSKIVEAFVGYGLGRTNDAELQERLTALRYDRSRRPSRIARLRSDAHKVRTKGHQEQAEALLLQALALAPNSVPTRLDLADLLISTDRIPRAKTLLRQILSKSPRHRRARMLEGIAFYKEGNLVQAEASLDKALVLNPSPARTHYFLGLICERSARKERALEHFRDAARLLLKRRRTTQEGR